MDPKCQSDDVEGYNRKCLLIVQKYIEIFDNPQDEHSLEEFLEDCHFITRAHFEDIIEERACTDLCGYVLCNNQLKETSKKKFKFGQKYHIHNNIVYDITRRKNFCSNHCFHCAEFLRSQINTEPLFLRKNDNEKSTTKKIELLQAEKTSGQFGDIIPLKDPLENVTKSKNKNESKNRTNNAAQQSIKNQILKNEKSVENKLSAPYLKEEEFNELKQKFQDFTIHETQIIDDHLSPRENSIKIASVNNKNNDEHKKLQDHQSDPMEIDGLSTTTTGSSKARKSKPKPKHSDPSDLLRKMSEWITVETRRFLGINPETENPPTNLTDNDNDFSIEDEQKKLEKYRWEYIRLCAKLNEEELEDEKYDQMVLNEKKQNEQNKKTKKKTKNSVLKESKSRTPTQTLTANKIIESEQELSSILTGKNHDQQVDSDQSKRVRFNEVVEENSSGEIAQNKIQDQQDSGAEESSEVLITPLNDNQHCDVKRRKSFLKILQKNLEEIFEDQFNIYEIGDVLEQIKSLVNTFNLNAQNTDLNWKNHHLATIILLRTLLIFDKLDSCKYQCISDSNSMIKSIMELFELTTDTMDEMIRKLYTNN